VTLAERLLAGEHHGCRTWADVAAKLGVDERHMRVVRKALEARGTPVGLVADSGVKTATPMPEYRDVDAVIEPPIKWPSVAAFDAEVPVPVVPVGHVLRGVSTLVGADGETKQQWIKTTAQNDERQAWLDAIRAIGEEMPRLEPSVGPGYCDSDLLAVYPVGDPHVGALAWSEDAGADYDMRIAEDNLVGAFAHLTALAPDASEALLIFIGDNVHADGQHNTTTKGTRVDVDSRTVKIARTAIRIGRRAVDLALQKHSHVRLIWERGNHDELISAMTALAFSLVYENDPRVSVDTSPEMFHWFKFGQNLIGTHHGDKVKTTDLLGVMAVDRAADWSACKYRRFYCGHYHHLMTKELPGLIVEYLPTLAGSDAWHRAMGYRSQRAMYMDVLHREWGHVNRHIVGIGQLEAA